MESASLSTHQKALSVNLNDKIYGKGHAFNSRLDRGWMPPNIKDVKAIEDENDGHEDDAVATGCEMIRALPRVNQLLADAGIEPLQIGVGINSGPAVIGSIGTSGRASFTAIGDTVNVSARIESLTKEAGYPLLLSGSTYDALSNQHEATRLEPMMVKGKARAITVYGIRPE